MIRLKTVLFLILASLLATGIFLTPLHAQETEATPEATEAAADPAIAFLQRLEKKHAETKTLSAEFNQLRVDHGFMNEVESFGRFWYEAPERFRASYESENSSEIWMLEGKLITYVPKLKQVEVIQQPKGDDAPINQLLLGFGQNVERIQELFGIDWIADAGEGEAQIKFTSKDLSRSMGYDVITITFSEESAEPKKIVLEDPQSTTTVELKKVKINPEISEKRFQTDWPDDTEVLEYDT